MKITLICIAFSKPICYFSHLILKMKMKKRILTLSLLSSFFVIGFSSCDKIKDKLFPAFDTSINDVSVSIPVTLAGAESSSSATVSFNLDSTIKSYTSNAFGVNNLSSVKVKDVNVFLDNADALNDISNFETVTLKFSSNTNTTPAVVVNAAIPNTAAADITIPATDSPELKDYLKGNQLTYTIAGKARRSTTKVLHATVAVTLSVK